MTELEKDAEELAYKWWHSVDKEFVDVIDAYKIGYQQAIEHPTGGELLHVLNKGHEQGYKDAIDKACKFFEERMWEMKAPDGEAYVVDGESPSISEFIKNFKEYMEEQQ